MTQTIHVSFLLHLPFKHYNVSRFDMMIKSVHHKAQRVLPLETPAMNATEGHLALLM